MNNWFYRAVGTVGIAGIALLSSGPAQAHETEAVRQDSGPQLPRGMFDDLFKPMGGLGDLDRSNAGASVDTPDILSALPVTELLPVSELGGPPDVTEAAWDKELLPGLPLLDMLPLGGPPGMGGLPLSDLPIASGLPLTGALPLAGGDQGDGPLGASLGLDNRMPVDDPVDGARTLPADENLHALPVVGGLMNQGGPLSGLPVVDGLASGDPLGGLPVVGGLVGNGERPVQDPSVVEDPDLLDEPGAAPDAGPAGTGDGGAGKLNGKGPGKIHADLPAPKSRPGERPVATDVVDEYPVERAYLPRHATDEELPVVGSMRDLPLVGSLLNGF